jgi:hypothetical protein
MTKALIGKTTGSQDWCGSLTLSFSIQPRDVIEARQIAWVERKKWIHACCSLWDELFMGESLMEVRLVIVIEPLRAYDPAN